MDEYTDEQLQTMREAGIDPNAGPKPVLADGEVDPTEVTVDGHVEPVVLEFGTDGQPVAPQEEADAPSPLAFAIAAHFDVPLEQVRRFIVVAEYEHGDGNLSVSSVWTTGTPAWDIRSLVAEAKRQTDAL
jgi:hypothetical protein